MSRRSQSNRTMIISQARGLMSMLGLEDEILLSFGRSQRTA